jgi:hypothetical protein
MVNSSLLSMYWSPKDFICTPNNCDGCAEETALRACLVSRHNAEAELSTALSALEGHRLTSTQLVCSRALVAADIPRVSSVTRAAAAGVAAYKCVCVAAPSVVWRAFESKFLQKAIG